MRYIDLLQHRTLVIEYIPTLTQLQIFDNDVGDNSVEFITPESVFFPSQHLYGNDLITSQLFTAASLHFLRK